MKQIEKYTGMLDRDWVSRCVDGLTRLKGDGVVAAIANRLDDFRCYGGPVTHTTGGRYHYGWSGAALATSPSRVRQ